jgi:hypothetical protein
MCGRVKIHDTLQGQEMAKTRQKLPTKKIRSQPFQGLPPWVSLLFFVTLIFGCLKSEDEITIIDSSLGKITPKPTSTTPPIRVNPGLKGYFLDTFHASLDFNLELSASDSTSLLQALRASEYIAKEYPKIALTTPLVPTEYATIFLTAVQNIFVSLKDNGLIDSRIQTRSAWMVGHLASLYPTILLPIFRRGFRSGPATECTFSNLIFLRKFP